MKKIIILIIICLFPITVLADNNIIIDNTDIKIIKGSSKTFNLKLNNAAGRLDISSSNIDIAATNTNSIFLDNENKDITIYGNSVGSTIIKVYVNDVSTYDFKELNGESFDININVFDRGDINYNNVIDLSDILFLLKKYLGTEDYNIEELAILDINNDNIFNLNDVILLLKKYLEIDY